MSLAVATTPLPRSKYCVRHLPDACLLRNAPVVLRQERTKTAEFLAHIAEIDRRKLFLPAGYPSMVTYCVGALGLTEEAAHKRIRVARLVNDFPSVLDAIAAGQMAPSSVFLLKPLLTNENVDELLVAVAGKTRDEIERLVDERRRPQLTVRTESPVPVLSPDANPVAPGPLTEEGCTVVAPGPLADEACSTEGTPKAVESETPPAQVAPGPPPAPATPFAPPQRLLRFAIDQETDELLLHAQNLLSHQVPSGSVAEVFKRSLVALVRQLEKAKFAKTERPQPPKRSRNPKSRHIPAHVVRAVRERDGDRCTFVGTDGHRCQSRRLLEFDHIQEFARGGEATVDGIRLLCRVHNQYLAEQAFGAEFVERKRQESRERRTRRDRPPRPTL